MTSRAALVSYFLQTLVIRAGLTLIKPLPIAQRARLAGKALGLTARFAADLKRRAESNYARAFPDMPASEQQDLTRQVANNIGQTLTEILFNKDYAPRAATFTINGPGFEVLQHAKTHNTGAIIVSGHFGQWEAVRHALKAQGMEVGALYRKNNNPYYEPLFRRGIEQGGTPIIARGQAGNRAMIRHLRDGGLMAILADQHVQDGIPLTFLGHPAATTLSPATLALRYEVPLVPCFGLRTEDGQVAITCEAPIPPSTPEVMMQDFNDRLELWVLKYPEQWHWFHQRWKLPPDTPAVTLS